MSGRVAIFSRTVRMLRQITSIGLVMSERTWRVVPWTAWSARATSMPSGPSSKLFSQAPWPRSRHARPRPPNTRIARRGRPPCAPRGSRTAWPRLPTPRSRARRFHFMISFLYAFGLPLCGERRSPSSIRLLSDALPGRLVGEGVAVVVLVTPAAWWCMPPPVAGQMSSRFTSRVSGLPAGSW